MNRLAHVVVGYRAGRRAVLRERVTVCGEPRAATAEADERSKPCPVCFAHRGRPVPGIVFLVGKAVRS